MDFLLLLLASILLTFTDCMYDAFYIRFGKLITRFGTINVTLWAILTVTLIALIVPVKLVFATEFNRTDALIDPSNRISPEFSIPNKMHQRTAFWFDVYTKYGSFHHVLHHSRYPWIVYKVINTENILSNPENRWVKYHKSVRFVKNETASVRKILRKLSKLKHYKKLSPAERKIFLALKDIPGKRQAVFKIAARHLRIQLGQKDFFSSGLIHSKRYLPIIEEYFTSQGLPTELARLPFVESSFNVQAESKVGASGIWQIMPSTGKSYLIVNNTIDERNSPLKASKAAVEIFKRNFRSLKKWPLAVTAYNHGATGVHRALNASRTTNLPDLIDKYHRGSFKFASANFYASFLAALHAEKYNEEIFKALTSTEIKPLNHSIVEIKRPTRVRQLLRQTGLSNEELLNFNLDLKRAVKSNAAVPRGYQLIVPAKTSG